MKFFRRKDKRKDDGDSGHSRMPGFGSSTNGKHSTPAYSAPGHGDSRAETFLPFGSPPSGLYNPRAHPQSARFQSRPTRASAAVFAHFPAAVFERIFTYVCPHTRDETYETCEQSSVEDGCMLCDLRDLAHCVAVCKKWRIEAVKLMYVQSQFPPCLKSRAAPARHGA
jgi:hypothetical protein